MQIHRTLVKYFVQSMTITLAQEKAFNALVYFAEPYTFYLIH